jgi:hypothetical protein
VLNFVLVWLAVLAAVAIAGITWAMHRGLCEKGYYT